MTDTKQIEFEEGSGNVFADLGLPNAEELLVRAQIGFHVATLISDRGLKQQEAADILGIKQSDVFHIMNGHFSRFTTDKLLECLFSRFRSFARNRESYLWFYCHIHK